MDFRVELLADYVWATEYDKIGFLSVGVDISIDYIRKTTNFLVYGANEYYKTKIWEMKISEKAQQIEIWDFLINDQNIMFGSTLLMEELEKSKMSIN